MGLEPGIAGVTGPTPPLGYIAAFYHAHRCRRQQIWAAVVAIIDVSVYRILYSSLRYAFW